MTLQCMQRGLHILLAKPLEQCIRPIELHDIVCTVGVLALCINLVSGYPLYTHISRLSG